MHDAAQILEHSRWLTDLARALVRDTSRADDVAQDAWLGAVRTGLSQIADLRAWLAKATFHLASTARRAERRRAAREERAARPEAAPAADAAVAMIAEQRELLGLVEALDEPYRTAILLRFFEALPPRAIAARLGVPVATVRTRVARGLERLRRALDQQRGSREAWLGAFVGLASRAALPGFTSKAMVLVMKLELAAVVVGVLAVAAAVSFWAWRSGGGVQPEASAAAPRPASSPGPAGAAEPASAATRDPLDREAPAPASRTEAHLGALQVHVSWPDGHSAPGIGVELLPKQGVGRFACRWVYTDARGIAECGGLVPGACEVSTRHGGSASGVVVAGEKRLVELGIPSGIDVRGVVLDPKGEPVVGASIVLGTMAEDMLEAGRADGNGRFTLRCVAEKQHVAALAEGWQASISVEVKEARDKVIELRMLRAAGTVVGHVRDVGGAPIPDAWVCAGVVVPERPWMQGLPPGFLPAHFVRTESDGSFKLLGIDCQNPCPVHAGAAEHGTWKREIRASPGQTTRVEVTLQKAVVLSGSARLRDGAPVPYAFVSVLETTSPAKGIGDARPTWMQQSLQTETQGSFVLPNLPAGKLKVSIWSKAGVAWRELDARPGERLTWDAVLEGDLVIQGTLRDARGNAIAGAEVFAEPPYGIPGHGNAKTDVAGRFTLTNCARVPYTVNVSMRRSSWTRALLRVAGIEPSDADLDLVIPVTGMPTCTIVGRTVAEAVGGRAFTIMASDGGDGSASTKLLQPGTSFELGPVAPGKYSLHAMLPSNAMVLLGRHVLVEGQRLDLGEVGLPVMGRIAVEVRDERGKPVDGESVAFDRIGSFMNSVAAKLANGRAEIEAPPGTYLPANIKSHQALEHPPVEVKSGEATPVQMRLVPAWRRTFRIDVTALGGTQNCTVRWCKAGTPLQHARWHLWQEVPAEIDRWFSAGAWTLELELPSGAIHKVAFEVTTSDSDQAIDVVVGK